MRGCQPNPIERQVESAEADLGHLESAQAYTGHRSGTLQQRDCGEKIAHGCAAAPAKQDFHSVDLEMFSRQSELGRARTGICGRITLWAGNAFVFGKLAQICRANYRLGGSQ